MPTPALPIDTPRLPPFLQRLTQKTADDAGMAHGWFSSSLDLKLGLEVRDLGPVECIDQWEAAFS
ncbi:MAG TPA: hypothetical protein VJ743_12720 [Albitalea sp.]|nr:hypothetical protein [Albitalea sp.]